MSQVFEGQLTGEDLKMAIVVSRFRSVGIIILAIGGLDAVQLSSVIVGVPMILVFALMTISFIKSVREDFGKKDSESTLIRYSVQSTSETQKDQVSEQREDVFVGKERDIGK